MINAGKLGEGWFAIFIKVLKGSLTGNGICGQRLEGGAGASQTPEEE